MKKILGLSFVFSFFLLFISCEEVGPNMNVSGGGNTGGDGDKQSRKVLVEEFTGVKCKNCPLGTDLLEQLIGIHGDKLVVVGIHTGFFATPYAESQHDFRTPVGDQIDTYLGGVVSNPAAAINRTKFEGQPDYIIGKQLWTGYIASELEKAPKVELDLEKSYNSSSRLLETKVDLKFMENITDPVKITVLVTESKIKDVQLLPDNSKNTEYIHKHVLRGALSDATGSAYTGGATTAGAKGSQSFSMTLPAGWKAENCSVVAFVSSATTKAVYQVEEKHIEN